MKAARWSNMTIWTLLITLVWSGTALAAGETDVSMQAKKIDGQIYVKADDMLLAFGGIGSYNEKAQTYDVSKSNITENAVQKVSPSVVGIIGKPASKKEGGSGRFELMHGTGIVVAEDGWIITNNHVVKDMTQIVVVTADGKQFSGRKTYADEESDLALIRINALGLTPATFAAKDNLKLGETVIAIGTPVSFSLRNSVTVGVISGIDRSVNSTYRLLQTDAAINPGNSGGALVNVKGEVVGINTLKFVESGVDSLGFAIPSDTVQYVMKQFQTYGKVWRPYAGFDLEESWAAIVGLPSDDPLTITRIDDKSPAALAGVKPGDLLIAVDGSAIATVVEYNELLKKYKPGDKAVLTLQSSGKTVKTTIVFGEDPDAVPHKPEASADEQLEMWMQLGNGRTMINGQLVLLEKPYLNQGSSYVPLKAFAVAFQSVPEWDAKTQTAVVRLGDQVISLTAGSKQASVNDQDVQLPGAPVMVGSSMMVPVRWIADQLGARVKFYAKTGELVVSGSLDTQGNGTGNIDSDAGKTKIGDSYYGWSMKYPSGLIKSYQSNDDDWISFYDSKSEYGIDLNIEPKEEAEKLPQEALLKKLKDNSYGTVLDQSYVENGEQSYAKLTSKSDYDGYSESRVYQNDKYLYFVTLSVFDEANYKSNTKIKGYQDLLNSFRTTFDAGDAAIKNVSGVKDGTRKYINEEYGITMQIPAGWNSSDRGGIIAFRNKNDKSLNMNVQITSVVKADTLSDWVERQKNDFESSYVAEYRKTGEKRDTQIAGEPAIEVEYAYTWGGDWNHSRVLYLDKGDYKYKVQINYSDDSDKKDIQALIDGIEQTMAIDQAKMDPSFGFIKDNEDMVDRKSTKAMKSKKYKYSLNVPQYWEASPLNDADGEFALYSFNGGEFTLQIEPSSTLDEVVKQLEFLQKQFGDLSANTKQLEAADLTLFGVPAKKYVYETKTGNEVETETSYIFAKNNNVYLINLTLKKATATEQNVKMLEDALHSFTFVE